MKLLAVEARQDLYYRSRHQQVEDLGAELFVLCGEGAAGAYPEPRYRIAGSKHIDSLIEAARSWHSEHRFDGVITFAEAAVIAAAAVAEALGLPGIGVEAARRCRNKLLMRQAHERGGAAHPCFRFVHAVEEAEAAAAEFGYPVILKPTLGAASNFVFRIDTPAEMKRRYRQAAAGIEHMIDVVNEASGIDIGPNGLLVESFLDGHEHLIEAVAWDDEVFLGSVVDRVTVEGDTFDDDVHAAPTALAPEQLAEVHRVVSAAVRAQGVRRSALHAEVRYHGDRPYMLEMAARPGGGGLDYMARLTAGHDPIRAVVDVARGMRPNVHHFQPTGVHMGALALICDAGVVDEVTVPELVTSSSQLCFLKMVIGPGDVVRRPPEGNDVAGYLGVSGTSRSDAMDTMTRFASVIQVKTRESAPVR
jgi:biotin carboxylase